jgi:hypothetical protein
MKPLPSMILPKAFPNSPRLTPEELAQRQASERRRPFVLAVIWLDGAKGYCPRFSGL